MKSLHILCVYFLVYSAKGFGLAKECIPKERKLSADQLITRNDLTADNLGFQTSRHKHGTEYNTLEQHVFQDGDVKYHIYSDIVILKAGSVQPFRSWSQLKMYNFLHGDVTVIHEIDKRTGSYTRRELGFHNNMFFAAIPNNNVWLAIDVESRFNLNYAMVGVTRVRRRNDQTNITWGKRSEMLQKFPQHKELIMKFTENE